MILNNSRLILSLNGIIMIIQGISFIIFANEITISMFPFSENNVQALELGVSLRYSMGSGSIFIGLLLFLCRGTTRSAAQKLLLGSGIGFLLLMITLLYILFVRNVMVPVPVLLVFFILSLLSLYVSTRKFQE